MQIKKLLSYLEEIAPPSLQESYDNAGLIVGDPKVDIEGVLICLDSTEAVIDEAIQLGCNLVIAHHPIVFKGLKRLNGKNYVERTVMKAIKNDIAIYAIHTNLDNVYYKGVNSAIAEQLGLVDTQILAPKGRAKKLITFVAPDQMEPLRKALLDAGAGAVSGFRDLTYASLGVGTRDGSGGAQVKLEVVYAAHQERSLVSALLKAHPEAHVPYDIIATENKVMEIGSGMIGKLEEPMNEKDFLAHLKSVMGAGCVRYTRLRRRKVRKVAVCGGSGGFLLQTAIARGADIFVTADYKYHEFFDADGRIVIADIGHYESEQFTIQLLHEIISNKFSIFAAHCTKVNTNPVYYL
ncbi:MAG: Nif3-like dinuclear metal center hexameric protein [Bacteroidota bacterium]